MIPQSHLFGLLMLAAQADGRAERDRWNLGHSERLRPWSAANERIYACVESWNWYRHLYLSARYALVSLISA